MPMLQRIVHSPKPLVFECRTSQPPERFFEELVPVTTSPIAGPDKTCASCLPARTLATGALRPARTVSAQGGATE